MQELIDAIDDSVAPCWCLGNFHCKIGDQISEDLENEDEAYVAAVVEYISQRWYTLHNSMQISKKTNKKSLLEPIYSKKAKTVPRKEMTTYLIQSDSSPKRGFPLSPFVCPSSSAPNATIVLAQLDSEMLRFSELLSQQRLPWQCCSCPKAIENMFIQRIRHSKKELCDYVTECDDVAATHCITCLNEAKIRLDACCDRMFEMVTDYESDVDGSMKRWSNRAEMMMEESRRERDEKFEMIYLIEESRLMRKCQEHLMTSNQCYDFSGGVNEILGKLDNFSKSNQDYNKNDYLMNLSRLRLRRDCYKMLTARSDYYRLVTDADFELEKLSTDFTCKLGELNMKKDGFKESSELFLASNLSKVVSLSDQVKISADVYQRHSETIIHSYGLNVDAIFKGRMKLDSTEGSRKELSWMRYSSQFQSDLLIKTVSDFKRKAYHDQDTKSSNCNRSFVKFRIKQKRSLDWAQYSNEQRLRSKFDDTRQATLNELNAYKLNNEKDVELYNELEQERRLSIDRLMLNMFQVSEEVTKQTRRIMSRLRSSIASFETMVGIESSNMLTQFSSDLDVYGVLFKGLMREIQSSHAIKKKACLDEVSSRRDENSHSLHSCMHVMASLIERQVSSSASSFSRCLSRSQVSQRCPSASLRRPESASRTRPTSSSSSSSLTSVCDAIDTDLSAVFQNESSELRLIYDNGCDELDMNWCEAMIENVRSFSNEAKSNMSGEMMDSMTRMKQVIADTQASISSWEKYAKLTIETVYESIVSVANELRDLFPSHFDVNGLVIDSSLYISSFTQIILNETQAQYEAMFSKIDVHCSSLSSRLKSYCQSDPLSDVVHECDILTDDILAQILIDTKESREMFVILDADFKKCLSSLICYQSARKDQISRFSRASKLISQQISLLPQDFQKKQDGNLKLAHAHHGLSPLSIENNGIMNLIEYLKKAELHSQVQQVVSESSRLIDVSANAFWSSVNDEIASFTVSEEEVTANFLIVSDAALADLNKMRVVEISERMKILVGLLNQHTSGEKINFLKMTQRNFDTLVEEEILNWEDSQDERIVRNCLIELVEKICELPYVEESLQVIIE